MSARYQLTQFQGNVLDTFTNTVFPSALTGQESADYSNWLAAGNTPDPAPAIVTPPVTVSMFQGKLALAQLGLLTIIESYINGLAPTASVAGLTGINGQMLQVWYSDAPNLTQGNPIITAVWNNCGLTTAQLTTAFTVAQALQV